MTRTCYQERHSDQSDRSDRGSATVFVLGFAVVLLAMAGLVVDGGLALNARQRVADDVEQAARAGSLDLNLAELRDQGVVAIDPGQAEADASTYLRNRDYTDFTVTANPGQVQVTAHTTQRTTLLALIFIKSFSVSASGEARPAVGGN